MNDLQEMTIGVETLLITPESPNYRVPSWPPPRDWPVVVDKNGEVISRWGDARWNLTPWAGHSVSLNFGDGERRAGREAAGLDTENANILRMLATWLLWGPQAARRVITIRTNFTLIRPILVLCSQNGISASRLMRFSNVFDQLPEVVRSSNFMAAITLLQRFYDARDFLGFTIVDQNGIQRLLAAAPKYEHVQTPYIPSRIWLYQLKKLRECLTDFQEHREQIHSCFHYCLSVYAEKAGSLQAALEPKTHWDRRSPFNRDFSDHSDFPGTFHDVAARFGIADILDKWAQNYKTQSDPRTFSDYFTLVTFAGLAYISNFTLQRKEEVGSLRSSCLVWEDDEQFGRVPIICGETTKTMQDTDARWVASPSIEIAVQTLSAIARLRMIADIANPLIKPSVADQNDPYLSSCPTEPWGRGLAQARPYHIRIVTRDIGTALKTIAPTLFDAEAMRITAADLELARRMTPNLPEEYFSIGKVWPLAWHQYRRTGTVNMFASGEISDQTIQHQLKHSSRLMPVYYGRNHSKLLLNKEVQAAVMAAMHEAQAKAASRAATSGDYISPCASTRKEAMAVNVLSANDMKDLLAMAKKGSIAFRENRLGGCMKAGVCEYGGIESVARCAGGQNIKPCPDVLYDRRREPQIRADVRRIKEEIKILPSGHPRSNALMRERDAMENYLDAISA